MLLAAVLVRGAGFGERRTAAAARSQRNGPAPPASPLLPSAPGGARASRQVALFRQRGRPRGRVGACRRRSGPGRGGAPAPWWAHLLAAALVGLAAPLSAAAAVPCRVRRPAPERRKRPVLSSSCAWFGLERKVLWGNFNPRLSSVKDTLGLRALCAVCRYDLMYKVAKKSVSFTL